MTISSDNFIEAAKHDGDQGSIRLLALYRNYLLLLARIEVGGRLRRKIDPSDLVQETLIEAHQNFARFEGTTEGQFLAWLRRILAGKAANTVRHYIGTRGRDIRHELDNDVSRSLDQSTDRLQQLAAPSGISPARQVMRREQSVVVANALQGLPEDYREVLLLRHWEDLTFPEIARRMERSVDSVEKLWMRALARVRQSVGATT
jgi:RNA polymerase sigma-70 factor (ECF subfamily)